MRKRGQLTLIILIGILVVTLTSTAIYYKEDIAELYHQYTAARAEAVPEQVQEINDFLYGCIEDTAEEALMLIGLQGGYIEIPADSIPRSSVNPFSNSLEIIPGSDLRVAYWYYRSANNIESSLMPGKEEMERELEQYLTKNLALCTGNFELFTRYNISSENISAEANIKKDYVSLAIAYPLHVETNDISYSFEDFYTEIEHPLGNLYELSKEILESENNEKYLEEKTIDMLVVYDELPFTEISVDCETKAWSTEEIKEQFKAIAFENTANIIIKGTNAESTVDKYYQWEALEGNAKGITSSLLYSTNWPFEMDVYPSENEIISGAQFSTEGADRVSALLRQFLCLESYRFIYDIRYPVLISLQDENGYIFQFALQVILDNNQPRENTAGGEAVDIDQRVCDSATQEYTAYVYGIKDEGLLSPLEDANVKFKCISSVCDIGATGNDGSLTALFPECVNGLIIAEKEGYKSDSEFLTTLGEPAYAIQLALDPKYNMQYEIKLIDAETGSTMSPSDESITLTITSEYGDEVITLTEYSGEIEIAQGEYAINGYIMKNADFKYSIEGKKEKKCVTVPKTGLYGLIGGTEQKCFDIEIPETKASSMLTGGIETAWSISREELADAQGITFYLTDYGLPEDYDEMMDMYSAFEAGLLIRLPELE